MSNNDRPSDSPLDEPEREPAKVLSIGSFSPGWDEERRTRTAQQQLRHDLANAFRSNEAAGKYDGDDK
jgi:hypothetical protein